MLNIQEYKGFKIDIEILHSNNIVSQKRVMISKDNKTIMKYKTFARDIEKDYKEEIDNFIISINDDNLAQLKEDKDSYNNIVKSSLIWKTKH